MTCEQVCVISIHSLRVEGDLRDLWQGLDGRYFNPLPPCGGRRETINDFLEYCISIHSLRVEGDVMLKLGSTNMIGFQSTPSVWRETLEVTPMSIILKISIHSLRVEGDLVSAYSTTAAYLISIHSLRVEGDQSRKFHPMLHQNFNPLPPCGGRLTACHACENLSLFQSTPSVWRETTSLILSHAAAKFQSTPSVWRETKYPETTLATTEFQSTPSVWRETKLSESITLVPQFQSTPSVWRETHVILEPITDRLISIHSLRVEGDLQHTDRKNRSKISIHSLRVEGDLSTLTQKSSRRYFNPLPPCGGRP